MTDLSRRTLLKTAAAAPIAAMVPVASEAQAPTAWKAPADAVSTYYRCVAGADRELQFLLADDTYRYATDVELKRYYDSHSAWIDNAVPDELRAFFADGDGELFALFAERHRIGQSDWADDGNGWTEAGLKAMRENLEAILETPAVTDAGVAMKLELLMQDTWTGERMPLHQQRQALWNALRWLQVPAFEREPMQARAIDRDEMSKHLRSYREKADA